MTALTHVVLAAMTPRLPYDAYNDFSAVAPVGTRRLFQHAPA